MDSLKSVTYVYYWQIGHFTLICASDKVWITGLSLIHKNMKSVRNSHTPFIGQSDVKHIMMSPIKTITSRQTDIITNIPAHPIELAEILAIMSVSTFKIDVILYLSLQLTIRSVKK
jgi:hypothetical protein